MSALLIVVYPIPSVIEGNGTGRQSFKIQVPRTERAVLSYYHLAFFPVKFFYCV